MACRGCKFFDLEQTKSATGRIMAKKAARCLWQMPEIDLPDSITFSSSINNITNPSRYSMRPNDGEGCKAFVPRDGEEGSIR